MKLRDVMASPVIRIHPDESVAVAARTLAHYNIGILPVCGADGRLRGLVTDRDLVTRCVASGRSPVNTTVREVMTSKIIAAGPEMDAAQAAGIMGREQVRRLPVVENGKLVGMISLGDLARSRRYDMEAAQALSEITENVIVR